MLNEAEQIDASVLEAQVERHHSDLNVLFRHQESTACGWSYIGGVAASRPLKQGLCDVCLFDCEREYVGLQHLHTSWVMRLAWVTRSGKVALVLTVGPAVTASTRTLEPS